MDTHSNDRPVSIRYGGGALLQNQTTFKPYLVIKDPTIFEFIFESSSISTSSQKAMATVILSNICLVFKSITIDKYKTWWDGDYLYKAYRDYGYKCFSYSIFDSVLKKLIDGGWISVITGKRPDDDEVNYKTRIMPTQKFIQWRIDQGELQFKFDGLPAIIKIPEPSPPVKKGKDKGKGKGKKQRKSKHYKIKLLPDNKTSMSVLKVLKRYNAFIDGANFTYMGDVRDTPCFHNRYLIRLFIKHSTCYGRFHKAFWINMKKDHRKLLRLDGERLIDFDFSHLFPTLLYEQAGIDLNQAGINPYYYDLGTKDRQLAKRIFNTMVNSNPGKTPAGHKDRAYKGVIQSTEYKSTYIDTYTKQDIKDMIAVLWEHNKSIQHLLFNKKTFMKLCKIESDTMLKIMKYCLDHKVFLLAVHDGALCKVSDKNVVDKAFSATGYPYKSCNL